MIKDVIIKKLQKFEDARGWLTEIFRDDEIEFKPEMSYVSITRSCAIRGPHEHKYQSDFFVFLGPGNFRLYLWDARKESATFGEHIEIEAGEDNPTTVIVPPGVVHGYKCISNTSAMCINLPDKLYRGKGKKDEIDEIRWEMDSDSPFKIK
ncbi:MAG: dTDP-4-dehydrorhamnose 3,5-epimerase family protein [bacterium]